MKSVTRYPDVEFVLVNMVFTADNRFRFTTDNLSDNCQFFFKTILHTPKVLCPTFGVHFSIGRGVTR